MRIDAALSAYVAERASAVVSRGRLASTAASLTKRIGRVDIIHQADLADAVEQYIATRRTDGMAANTIRRELITLRAALRLAWKVGTLSWTPHVAAPPPGAHRQRWLMPDEARRMMHRMDARAWLACRLMLMTGARIGAVVELTWDRVDLDRGIIDYRCLEAPLYRRMKARAVVPIAKPLIGDLRYARERAAGEPRVVPYSCTTIQRHVRAASEEAGLGRVTPHVLRHTAATWMLGLSKRPLAEVSRMLGHRSTLITEEVYAHLTPTYLAEASDALAAHLIPDGW